MKIDDILNEWEQDATFDYTNKQKISQAIISIPKLHHKYTKILIKEKTDLYSLQDDYKKLKSLKYIFYLDGPTKEQIDMGWKLPAKGKIMKVEIPTYMEGDEHLLKMSKIVREQEDKIECLKQILNEIHNLSYVFNAYIKTEIHNDGG